MEQGNVEKWYSGSGTGLDGAEGEGNRVVSDLDQLTCSSVLCESIQSQVDGRAHHDRRDLKDGSVPSQARLSNCREDESVSRCAGAHFHVT